MFAIPSVLFGEPALGERDKVVITLVQCVCVGRPSGYVRAVTCVVMHGFQNGLARFSP